MWRSFSSCRSNWLFRDDCKSCFRVCSRISFNIWWEWLWFSRSKFKLGSSTRCLHFVILSSIFCNYLTHTCLFRLIFIIYKWSNEFMWYGFYCVWQSNCLLFIILWFLIDTLRSLHHLYLIFEFWFFLYNWVYFLEHIGHLFIFLFLLFHISLFLNKCFHFILKEINGGFSLLCLFANQRAQLNIIHII